MEIDTLDGALKLFEQIGGMGNENCIFIAQTDQAHISGGIAKPVLRRVAYGLTGGISELVGDIAKGSKKTVEEFRQELNLDVLNNYMQFLINETEDTIAIIPIHFTGTLRWKTEGMQFFPESGRVIPKSVIEKIEIRKFGLITPTVRGIKFTLIDGYSLEFMGITNLKTLSYHIKNFKRFNDKYTKK